MSIPSITIRIDFGEGGISSATAQQGVAPTPVEFAGLNGSADGHGVPTPTGNPAAADAQSAPPTPNFGLLGIANGATVDTPPVPSGSVPGLQHEAGDGDSIPQPTAEPSGTKSGRK